MANVAADSPNLLRRGIWDDVERKVMIELFRQWAAEINYIFADGAAMTQTVIPPTLAVRKRDMSAQGGADGSAGLG